MRNTRWMLLFLLAMPVLAGDRPDAEETAALLLSPDADRRTRGLAVLEGEPGRGYERAVMAIVGQRAGAREAWVDELEERAAGASGGELLKLRRMLDALLDARDATIGVDLYFVSVPPRLAARILGPDAATVVHADPGVWTSWWEAIRAAGDADDAEVLFRRALPTRDTRPASFRRTRKISYVKGYETEETDDGTLLVDPVVDTVESGVVMRWRPHLGPRERFVTLACEIEITDVVRPIRTARQRIEGHEVRIQLPEVSTLTMEQTVTLPLGGHAAWRIPDPAAAPDARVLLVVLRAVRGEPREVPGLDGGEDESIRVR